MLCLRVLLVFCVVFKFIFGFLCCWCLLLMIVTFMGGYAVYAKSHGGFVCRGAKHCRMVKLRYNYLMRDD